jgi:hypothetical protein
MKVVHIAIVAMVSGCAITSDAVVDTGTEITGTIKMPPREAARCVARAAENATAFTIASERDIDDTNTELVIRISVERPMVWSVWRFTAAEGGSTYRVWVTPHHIASPEGYVARSRGGC